MYRYMFSASLLALVGLTGAAPACPYRDAVEAWYAHYLHRPLDCLGERAWVPQLAHGTPADHVLAGIIGSDEYYCRHGRKPCGFVTGLYQDVVGRRPCPAEVRHWVGQLGACGCRVSLAKKFLCAFRSGALNRAPVAPPPPDLHAPAPAPAYPLPAPALSLRIGYRSHGHSRGYSRARRGFAPSRGYPVRRVAYPPRRGW